MRRRRPRQTLLAGLLVTAAVLGCAESPSLELRGLDSPAPPGSAEPNLAVGPDGIYLSWLEQTGEDTYALRFARHDGEAWSEPRTVMERSGLFVNWADFPSLLVLEDGTIAAHWLEMSGPGTYSYDVRMALSTDGGATWSDDIVPHRDGIQAEHGFVSLFPAGGAIGVVWLDGRETVEGDPMTLRYTTVAPDGSLGPPVLLDDGVCDCCQTGVALAGDVPVVAYRDRTAAEIRDIAVTRRVDGRWTEPARVHPDRWEIEACPVNGPAVAADGRRVAVAWFTAARDTARVLVAFSDDAGASFDDPIRVDDGAPTGRVDLVMLDGGTALVTWLERGERGAEVRTRPVPPGGNPGASIAIGATTAERASGFPHVAGSGDRLLFAFTRPGAGGAPSRVRAVEARLDGWEVAPR